MPDRARAKEHRWRSSIFMAMAALAALAGGTWMLASVSHHAVAGPPAPLPAAVFDVAPGSSSALPDAAPGGCRLEHGPSRIVIPSLCVSAPVAPTSINRRALVIPDDVATVGRWRDGGTLATGTVLLAGHVNAAGQGPGALAPVHRIEPGALIEVIDDAGQVTRWTVTALASMPKADLPAWVFAGADGPRRLAVVTCGGPVHRHGGHWTYDDNILVTALPA